ncbi:MAG: hypothetical protein B7Z36_03540 [Novosphingobium sp. 12-63-9]|nr:MAG: hypothetical protein B7Z36_03540 [Novosphingobium sp. 12-63-9]
MIAGRRILIVEDEFIVAAMLADVIEFEGAEVVGPAGSQAEGLARAASGGFDAAVLDWNLSGEPGAPIARALRKMGVPFLIATGYGAVEAEFADVTVLSKPYAPGRLVEELARLLG